MHQLAECATAEGHAHLQALGQQLQDLQPCPDMRDRLHIRHAYLLRFGAGCDEAARPAGQLLCMAVRGLVTPAA